MKTGLESVKAALRSYFDSAAEDLEKTQENLKLGQFTHSREQPRGVTQIINYTTFALLPVLSSLFEHIGQNMFGEDLICAYWLLLFRLSMNETSNLKYSLFKCFLLEGYEIDSSFFLMQTLKSLKCKLLFVCFSSSSGWCPGFLLQNPQQPLLSGNQQKHLCREVQYDNTQT